MRKRGHEDKYIEDVHWSLQAVEGEVEGEAGSGEQGPGVGTGSQWGLLNPQGAKDSELVPIPHLSFIPSVSQPGHSPAPSAPGFCIHSYLRCTCVARLPAKLRRRDPASD